MHVVWDGNGQTRFSSFFNVREKHIKDVFRDTAIRILKVLEKPKTLSQIARDLGMTPQTVLYHLKRLRSAGAVSLESGKFYKRVADSYGVVLDHKVVKLKPIPSYLSRFFHPFAENSLWKSVIVVGSPDPHGYYLQRARDGHYSAVLGMFIGKHFETSDFPVRVDTDVAYLWKDKDLVLLGGPVSNTVTFELVEETGLFFDLDRPWMMQTRKGTYTADNIGLIAKIRNNGHWYLVLAGISALGTKSTILGLTSYTEELLTRYVGDEYYWIVEGLDRDGDGSIETIRVLEHGPVMR